MKLIDRKLKKNLIEARRYLHKFPELSGEEINTSVYIEKYLRGLKADEIITGIGGKGIAAVFRGKKRGKRILLRCELDALPIQESNTFMHKSKIGKVSHMCGHDGHMVILLGVADILSGHKLDEGEVILLFQPAEETGKGALGVIGDPAFNKLVPDYVFALHNIPGYPANSIIIKDGCFASASAGMECFFYGKISHAAEPEKGNNPALAVSRIIQALYDLNKSYGSGTFLTVVHVDIGEKAYGTSPGQAVLRCTLRSTDNSAMSKLAAEAQNIVSNISLDHELTNEINIVEEFPALMNDPDSVKIVIDSAKGGGMEVIGMGSPFPWSEDFSHFLKTIPGCLFGLGAGKDHPKLHQPEYDFPNEIIDGGIKMFFNILKRISG